MNRLGKAMAAGALAILSAAGAAHAEPDAGTAWVEPITGMKFTWIPSGCFNMGDTGGNPNELPVHKVCVKGFYLGVYEVTQAQYQKMTGKNPSNFRDPGLPVETVSWVAAQAMAQKLAAQSGAKLRLPSEAEWEYACRAGGRHITYCGDGNPSELAWYLHNSGNESATVGTRKPNAWGLYDMSGNVWEWTLDCWHGNYVGAPDDGSAWTAGGDCKNRVARGGSWAVGQETVRAGVRNWNYADNDFTDTGFRLVRE